MGWGLGGGGKEAMDKVSDELEYLQSKLVKVVSKKPKD